MLSFNRVIFLFCYWVFEIPPVFWISTLCQRYALLIFSYSVVWLCTLFLFLWKLFLTLYNLFVLFLFPVVLEALNKNIVHCNVLKHFPCVFFETNSFKYFMSVFNTFWIDSCNVKNWKLVSFFCIWISNISALFIEKKNLCAQCVSLPTLSKWIYFSAIFCSIVVCICVYENTVVFWLLQLFKARQRCTSCFVPFAKSCLSYYFCDSI